MIRRIGTHVLLAAIVALSNGRVAIADTAGIDGTVRDAAGKPVAGALVVGRSARHVQTVTTDARGRFKIGTDFNEPYALAVTARGFKPWSSAARTPAMSADMLDVTYALFTVEK